ncbi:hypothetical protein [Pseudoalteromonas sp. S16_S37]|uniref:hypothetical protein n=1 Tax=Pseudoalteromonas sp. S16_S37 TaxID=2720228 RepID=UPI001681B823|nr:hypothetical protein [Pseudoalteromonas sp. S16_S37]MBD1582076.1 hypothetical protein [Pseudoalteromonas sp. S16_S37]
MTFTDFFFVKLGPLLHVINIFCMVIAFFVHLLHKPLATSERGSVLMTLGLTSISYGLSFTTFDWHTSFLLNPYVLFIIYDIELLLLLWLLHVALRQKFSISFFYLFVFSVIDMLLHVSMYVDLVIFEHNELWWFWYIPAILGKFTALCLVIGLCSNRDFLKLKNILRVK